MLDHQLQRQEYNSQIQEAGQGQTLDLGQDQGLILDQGHAHVQIRMKEVRYPDQIQGHPDPGQDPGQGVVGAQGHSHLLI